MRRGSPRCSPTCRSRRPSPTAASSSPCTSRSPDRAGRKRHPWQQARQGPGAIRVAAGHASELNADRRPDGAAQLIFINTGDRPIQIGSHIHLADVNPALEFDRAAAQGFRLDIPAGTSLRFEPGRLPRGRHRRAAGPQARSPASRSNGGRADGLRSAASEYAALYGPTAGDQIRLGDTDLWIEIEADLTFGGEESVFGGGKSIRESMNQSTAHPADGALDTVITNAIILDHWGIVRADVGIRDGRIVALGRAGNPDIADGVTPTLVIGPATDVISGEGKILTAGGFDSTCTSSRRRRSSRRWPPASPPSAAAAPARRRARRPPRSPPAPGTSSRSTGRWTTFPVNLLLLGKGNTVSPRRLAEQALAGAGGVQGARGLGLDPGRHRRRPARGRRVGPAGRAALRLAQRGRLRRVDHRGDRRPVHLRLPRRGRRRRARPGHPDHRRAAERPARVDQPDAAAHGQHRRRAPRHADGLPPPQPGGARGPGLRRVPDPGHHDRGRGHPARPRGASRSPPPTPRRWAGSAR